MNSHLGGSFAPPLTDAKLAAYAALAASLPASALKDAVQSLLALAARWWELPESSHPKAAHPALYITDRETGAMRPIMSHPLEAAHAEELDPLIPWDHEIEALKKLFDGINPVSEKPLRDAAHHLLWVAIELDKGREPITVDKL